MLVVLGSQAAVQLIELVAAAVAEYSLLAALHTTLLLTYSDMSLLQIYLGRKCLCIVQNTINAAFTQLSIG